MTSSLTQKPCASVDNSCKRGAVTICQGCSKSFCMGHMNDHRRSLGKQMKDIISQSDRLNKSLKQRTTNPDSHTLFKEIANWEEESIAKIRQRAKQLRELIQRPTAAHISDLSEKFQELSQQLKERRENNDFIDTDIDCWKQKLNALETEVASSSTILVNRCNNDSLTGSISVSVFKMATELFGQASDAGVQIKNNGQVAVHNGSDSCTDIRGKEEYMSGCHEICLCIEQTSNSWTFLGINSKSTEVKNASYNSKSTYGWSSDNCIWSNGGHTYNKLKSRIEIENNDTISLLLDCDNRKIAMVNRRTNAKHELNVKVDQCPLPWQIHVILCEPNGRVCICLNNLHLINIADYKIFMNVDKQSMENYADINLKTI